MKWSEALLFCSLVLVGCSDASQKPANDIANQTAMASENSSDEAEQDGNTASTNGTTSFASGRPLFDDNRNNALIGSSSLRVSSLTGATCDKDAARKCQEQADKCYEICERGSSKGTNCPYCLMEYDYCKAKAGCREVPNPEEL